MMIRKVHILVKINQYESKRHFSRKMAEAFRRAGVEAELYDTDTGSFIDQWRRQQTGDLDLACSFNRFHKMPDGHYMWENMSVPFVSFLIDPIVYNLEAVRTPKAMATCVDRDDLAFANQYARGNLLFMPHAVERELAPGDEDRVYPAVFIGSSYDPDNLKAHWRKNLAPELCEVVEEAVDAGFGDLRKTFMQATDEALAKRGLQHADVPLEKLYYYVDNYMRGYDRVALIRAIKDVEVHIFGGTCWRAEKPVSGWNRYFAGQRNVVLHPTINYDEAMGVLRKSKICLNSVPTLRNGSHERVFAAYASGALPISSDNVYWREIFGSDIPLYGYGRREEAAEFVREYLADEPKRAAAVERGREIVLAGHTWDHRVKLLLEALPGMAAAALRT